MTTTSARTKVSRGSLEKENLLSIQEEKFEMTLNTDNAIAQGLLIQRLTELYEDPIEATVRETVSNGLDALAVAFSGEKAEIQVETPSELNPVFTVSDNGVGMTYDDLKEIYSRYGASTKTDNFDQIGAYGLGAKAPLAYGTQFTVTSVKDGIKTTIIVVREELTNYIRVIESGPSDEPTGTTVSVPVANDDINKFTQYVERYKNSPIDYSADLYVNGELVKGEKFALIDEEVVVFSENGEEVTARMWMELDKNKIVNLLTNLDESNFKRNIKFVIGGWAYSSPEARDYYYRSNSSTSVYVELKPGIVAFNSARDAILSNERFKKFENLISEYVKSKKFLKKMTKTINSLDIETFKNIVITLLNHSMNRIEIGANNELSVTEENSYGRFMHNFNVSDFVHEETGFDFTHITKGVPTKKVNSAILVANKVGYRSTMEYSVVVKNPGNRIDRNRNTRASEAVESLRETLEGTKDSVSLASLMLTVALQSFSNNSTDKTQITMVTDMVPSEDKKSAYQKVLTSRKTIIEMRNEKGLDSFTSYILYTKHDKASIEKMIKLSMLENMNVKVRTAEELTEEINEYRKENRNAPGARTVNKDFNANVYSITEGSSVDKVKIENLDAKAKNVFIISRDRFISAPELTQYLNGYCNENKLDPETVNIYAIVGNVRVVEMNVLSELGEMYEHFRSPNAGTSNLYNEKVAGKRIEQSLFSIYDKNLEKKSFIRLLSSLNYNSPSETVNELQNQIEEFKKVAELMGVETVDFDFEALQKLGEFGNETFGTSYSKSYWSLSEGQIQELVNKLSKDKYKIVELMSMLLGARYSNNSQIYISEDGKVNFGQKLEIIPSESTATVVKENPESTMSKVIKSNFELLVKEFTSQLKMLSTINF